MKGTASTRVMSVSIASGLTVATSIGTQLLLVPVFLQRWTAEEFGAWLGVETCLALFSVLGLSYQDYVGSRFLLCDRADLGRQLSIAIYAALGNAFVLMACGVLLVAVGLLPVLVGVPQSQYLELARPVELAFLVGIVAYSFGQNIYGAVDRAIIPLGYNPTAAWVACGIQLISTAAPAVVVSAGGDLLMAALSASMSRIILGFVYLFHIYQILRRESVVLVNVAWRTSLGEFLSAQVLTLKFLADRIRQDGSRLIVAPMLGSAGLASFSTIRTAANAILQSMTTISRPVFPELIRYLRNRDQLRMEFCFSIMWLPLISLVIPGTMVLQLLVGPLFDWWTLGRLQFNATLFATASLSGLVSAYALPAHAVLRGNNLISSELLSTVISGGVMLAAFFTLVPYCGLAGAGWALLIGECTSAAIVVAVAQTWLTTNQLQWPRQLSWWMLAALAVSVAVILAVALLPSLALPLMIACLPVYAVLNYKFWISSPGELRARMRARLWIWTAIPANLKRDYEPS